MSSVVQHYESKKNANLPVISQRICVIGSGPAGMRFVKELLQRDPLANIHIFGNEPCNPYNRVQLSALLAGDVERANIDIELPSSASHSNFKFTIARIKNINKQEKYIVDAHDEHHEYDILVIATSARAHVPHIDGVKKTGVYTFRNIKDTESLYSRVARARHIVVVGGGLLGIEAARGLLRFSTKITLVQQAPRLMNRQLDEVAANILRKKVEALGIDVVVNSGVREILGQDRVEGVRLLSEEKLQCDTVLMCAGIKPNIEIARQAGLKVATGITVNDQLQTSEKNIFSIGECCEHMGQTYGLVNPGYEQASVLAAHIFQSAQSLSGDCHYPGSVSVSRLKVVGETVFSMGQVTELIDSYRIREYRYSDKKNDIYRKVVLEKGRVIGAIGMGVWDDTQRLQEAFFEKRNIGKLQLLRFLMTGHLWSKDETHIRDWPANTIVCQCNSISQGALVAAIHSGCSTVAKLQQETEAGTVCGSCKPLLSQFFEGEQEKVKATGWLTMLLASVVAFMCVLLLVFYPSAQVSDSVQTVSWFEKIWNDKWWKQVTGFTLLGITVFGLIMSLRKRFAWSWLGGFGGWRIVHSVAGVLALSLLVFHTGLNLGENLNALLIINFLLAAIMGIFAGSFVALAHKFKPAKAQKLVKFWNWLHILVTWPLPALIGIHIFTVYYF